MCGITGIFAFNTIGRMALIHLEEATRSLHRRGPDAHDTWFDHTVGLGHRRLSIIDTSHAANQPMQDASGRYTIVFNGEIYNYRQLKKELSPQGISWKTESDTEVLLYAYIHWGPQCLTRLNGFFAFAVYDQQEGSLFIARDRFGIKPLLYFQDEDRVIFASEMKSLLAYGIPRQINREVLRLYFQLTYIPAPHSLLEGVQKLLPGHYLMIQKGHCHRQRWYELPFREKPEITDFAQAQNQLVNTLRQSVHDRLVADVPLGAFLSGGIDSSVIVALASEQVKGLKTFSIGFRDHAYFDETRYAELVARRYQTDHLTFSLTNDDLLSEVDHVLDYLDEPFADSSALPVHILSRQTRQHVTVALSGDGADEIFSGYNKHAAWLMAANPTVTGSIISGLGPVWNWLPKSRSNPITDAFRKLDRMATTQKLDIRKRYLFLASFAQSPQLNRLLSPEYQAEMLSYTALTDALTPQLRQGSLNEVLAADVALVLQGDMLPKVDLMSMANGLEVRVPFLDPAVVALAFNMPADFKATGRSRKIILREAFHSFLPEELYHRPKHGFEVPLLPWFKNELRGRLDEWVFNEKRIRDQGIFRWDELAALRSKLHSWDPGDSHVLVWSLLVFQHWWSRYFLS